MASCQRHGPATISLQFFQPPVNYFRSVDANSSTVLWPKQHSSFTKLSMVMLFMVSTWGLSSSPLTLFFVFQPFRGTVWINVLICTARIDSARIYGNIISFISPIQAQICGHEDNNKVKGHQSFPTVAGLPAACWKACDHPCSTSISLPLEICRSLSSREPAVSYIHTNLTLLSVLWDIRKLFFSKSIGYWGKWVMASSWKGL